MGQLDASIVTLATPALQEHFQVSLGAASWVALSYLLVLVAAVVPIGRLADTVGRKMLYVYGFAVFTLASLGCALSPSIFVLDGFRVVQALGAAMLQANSVALIRLAMPPGKVGRGIGVQGVAQALGLALGPPVGGLLVHVGGWRLVFLVNLPAGVIGIVAGLLFLPRSKELQPRTNADLTGLLLLVPAVTALMLTLTNVQQSGFLTANVLVPFALTAVSIAALAWHTRNLISRRLEPLLPVDLFVSRPFAAGIGAGLLSYLVLFGILFITPFELERTMGWTAAGTGLLLTVLPVSIAICTPIAGRLADTQGARLPTALGMTVTAIGFAVAIALPASAIGLGIALMLVGVGSGLFTPANNAAIMTSAPSRRASVAGGVLNMTRAFGTALGVAITSLLYELSDGGTAGYRAAVSCLAVLAGLAALTALTTGFGTRTTVPARAERVPPLGG
jgi:EmrB/QacA subfamily drug resistance transporter